MLISCAVTAQLISAFVFAYAFLVFFCGGSFSCEKDRLGKFQSSLKICFDSVRFKKKKKKKEKEKKNVNKFYQL